MKNRLATRRIFTNFCSFAFFIVVLQIQTLAAGGDLDTTFNAGVAGFGSFASVVTVQADGRVLVGGSFTVVNGRSYPYLARLNADGTIDQSFNPDGTGPNSLVSAIAVQTDGKILIGGNFFNYNGAAINYLARLNQDGSLDTTFNMGGAGPNSLVDVIRLQPNGQILIAGFLSSYNGTTTPNYLTRLNSDGTLDATFNTNLGTGFDNTVSAIVVQTNGQIVVGGSFLNVNGTAANYLVRLNSNGTRDTAFTTNGGTGFSFYVYALAVQTDGKIIVGGAFTNFNGAPANYLARLNPNGSLDANFNPAVSTSVSALQIQTDGRILAGGTNAFFGAMFERSHIARLTQADGSLDLTFDAGTASNFSSVSSIALQLDGTIFVGGGFNTFNGITRTNLVKLNTNGSVNTAFSTVLGIPAQVNDIFVLPDNKILIAGDFRGANESLRDTVVKLNADGTTDTTFNPGSGTGGFYSAFALAVQTDGKILVGGDFPSFGGGANNSGIARLNADGSLDATFDASVSGTVNAIAVQTDGKILIGGNFSYVNGTPGTNYIARLNADGTTDGSFNSGTGFNFQVEDLVLVSGGQIIVGGQFTEYNGTTGVNRIARLNANGMLDSTFTTNTGTGFDHAVYELAVQTDGKIIAGGFFDNFNGAARSRIARLNSNGTLDGTFNVGTGFSGFLNDLALQTDGRILTVGSFSTYNGVAQRDLARLNTDGSLDASFSSGAYLFTTLNAVALQTDGRILIGGNLSFYDDTPRFGIARVLAGDTIIWTGAADTSWNNGANWQGGIVPTAADNAVIGNNFTVNLSSGNPGVLTLTLGTNSTLTIASNASLSIEGGTNNGTIAGAGTLNFVGTALGNNGTVSVSSVNAQSGTSNNKALTGAGAFVGNLLTIAPSVALALQNNHQFNEISIGAFGALDATSRTVNLRGANALQGFGVFFNAFGTTIFDGAAAQTISSPVNFNNLTINNAAGVTFSSGASSSVSGTLTLTNGILANDSANAPLAMFDSASVVRADGYVTGLISKNFSVANLPFTFPIGTANGYSPVTVNITSGSTQVTANVFQTTHPNFELVAATSLRRYWTLSGTGTFTANLTFNYLQADVFGNENNYLIARITNGLPQSFPNNCAAGSPCVNAAANTATINGVTAFSDWTLAQFPPTAASVTVAGRVKNSNGKGITGARISMIDENGNARTATTNFHGYYRFAETAAGKTYILSARSKWHEFNPPTRVIFVGEDVGDADFTAAP